MCCHCGSGDLLGFASRLLIEMAHFCAFGCQGSCWNHKRLDKWRIRSRIIAISEHVTRRLSPRIAKQEASGNFLESVGSSFTSYAIHLQKDAGERVEDFLQFFDQRRSLFLREPDERAELVKQSVAVGIVFANACNRRAVGLEL